jgi:hypothetical protein
VSVHLTKFTAKRLDKKATAEVIQNKKASGDAGRWQTNLLPAGAMEKISKLDGEIRRFHYEHTLAWSDSGARLLPSKKFLDYSTEMRKFKARRETEVCAFVSSYNSHVAEARRTLGDLFDDSNYPSDTTIADKFQFRWDNAPVPASGDFRIDVSQRELEEMEESLNGKLQAAEQAAVNDLLERLSKPLSDMADRLGDPDAVFRDSLVENLRGIIKVLPDLNITGNKKLLEIADALQKNVTLFDADQLRSDKQLRGTVAKRVDQHLENLQSLFPAA